MGNTVRINNRYQKKYNSVTKNHGIQYYCEHSFYPSFHIIRIMQRVEIGIHIYLFSYIVIYKTLKRLVIPESDSGSENDNVLEKKVT